MSSKLQRLFVKSGLAHGAAVPLDKDQAHYLGNVLRLKPGDALLLFNGRTANGAPSLPPSARRGARLGSTHQTRPQEEAPTCIICSRR